MYPALNGMPVAGRVDRLDFGRLASKVGDHGVEILPGSAMKAGNHIHTNDSQQFSADKIRENERLMRSQGVIDVAGFVQALSGRGLKNMPPEESARVALESASAVMREAGEAYRRNHARPVAH
jgi:hypothetical protein